MSLIQMAITVVLRFVAQSYFVRILGLDYQGLNGLFTSIIGMLGITELGLGTAIVFNMYQYISKNDTAMLRTLMILYKWCYRAVAASVLVFGLLLMPFLHFFVQQGSVKENVYLIFLLFLLESALSYLFVYRQSIILANQQGYIITLANLAYNLVFYITQILLLIHTHSYILILISVIVYRLIENICISLIADRKYPYIKGKLTKKMPRSLMKNFLKQMHGQIYHITAGFIVFGMDSMIITYFLGVRTMGLYSNYILITTTLTSFLAQLLGSVTASVGNLLTEHRAKESFEIHKKLTFLTFWIYSFISIGLYVSMQPFISLWLGKGYLLPNFTLAVIVFNFYVQGMKQPIAIFQSAAGIFYENRHVPILESIANLIASIILVQIYGLPGVLMGTLISTMILYGYSFPKYTFVPIFKQKVAVYVKEQVKYFVLFIILFLLSALIAYPMSKISAWGGLIMGIAVAVIIPNAICFYLFRRSNEFLYFKNLIFQHLFKSGR